MPILGLDAHAGYGRIDWARVAAAGVRFANMRCTVGNDDILGTPANEGKDARFDENVAGAKAQGIYVGAYIFAYPLPIDEAKRPGRSPKDQARRFYADSKGLGKGYGELPPIIDFEWPPSHEKVKGTSQIVEVWSKWKVDAKFLCDWAEECIDEIERLWERTPILYTYRWFARTLGEHIRRERFARCPLWLPDATHLQDWLPPEGWAPKDIPAPWTKAMFVQHGFDGSSIQIPGIKAVPVDRDCFMGSLNELKKLAQIDPDADTQPEIQDPDETQPVRVPTMRPDPFETRIVRPTIDFPPRRYDRGPGEPPDDAA